MIHRNREIKFVLFQATLFVKIYFRQNGKLKHCNHVFPVSVIKYSIYMTSPLPTGKFLLNLPFRQKEKNWIKNRHKFNYWKLLESKPQTIEFEFDDLNYLSKLMIIFKMSSIYLTLLHQILILSWYFKNINLLRDS